MKKISIFLLTLFTFIVLCSCGLNDSIKIPQKNISKMTFSSMSLPVETTDKIEIQACINLLEQLDASKTNDFFQESPNVNLRFYHGSDTEYTEVQFNSYALSYIVDSNPDRNVLVRVTTMNTENIPKIIHDQYYYVSNLEEMFTPQGNGSTTLNMFTN